VQAEAFEHGTIAVFGKPFNSEILLAVIESTFARQAGNQSLRQR
jgi:hypothetical protein